VQRQLQPDKLLCCVLEPQYLPKEREHNRQDGQLDGCDPGSWFLCGSRHQIQASNPGIKSRPELGPGSLLFALPMEDIDLSSVFPVHAAPW